MADRTVRVFLHNETTFPLNLTHAEVNHGNWGADGTQRPPATVAAGGTVMMRTESTGLLPSGTEAHVTYRIGSDSTAIVNLHWNNPFVGHNSYHQGTDSGHFVFRVGGSGNDAVVHFFLRSSDPRSTGFTPDRDGFQFSNHWPDTPYSLPPLRGSVLDLKYGNAANGLCGGMVFAALDYFEERRSIPATTTAPFGEQDPLFRYLVDRQFATFSIDTVSLMLKLMNPIYPDTDENVLAVLDLASGRSSVMANEEWPLIRADIDAGHPSPMVLITIKSLLPWDLGHCHQVLAYAYEVHGDDVLLRVYDPNQPRNNDIHLRFNIHTVAERIVVEHNVAVHEEDGVHLRPIYCFARMNYAHRTPTVATPPRPLHPPVVVPRQVHIEMIGGTLLSRTFVEKGRKLFDVLMCGEREFDFTRFVQQLRISVRAVAISYLDPQVSWVLNDVAVPPGSGRTIRPHPSDPDNPYTEQDATGLHASPPVTVRTTTEGMLLHVENVPEDGVYSLTARAVITERDGSERREWTMTMTFHGSKEVVPGLSEAQERCLTEWLNSLRQESPDDEAIAKAVYAQLGRPPDPIWDPDPVLIDDDNWQDAVIDPDQAQFLDPAAQVDQATVTAIPTIDQSTVVVTNQGTDMLTLVETGTDTDIQVTTAVASRTGPGATVVNTTGRDLVVVNPETHKSVAVIPALQTVTLEAVKKG